jgi:predicted AlkP superfamily phosphohydrolase/phosphomutase
VNLKGREPQGIVAESENNSVVNEAVQVLLDVAAPGGRRVFEKVLTRGEAFNGRYSNRLPDVVVIPVDDEYVYNERPGYGELMVPADSTTGTHARDGIFIAWGSGITPGKAPGTVANLRDVGPTALYAMGLPVTEDMDGRPLIELFDTPAPPKRQGTSYRFSDTAGASVYSESEEAEITERLRALGYIE